MSDQIAAWAEDRKAYLERFAAYEAERQAWEEEKYAITCKLEERLEAELDRERRSLRKRTEEEAREKREALQKELEDCAARKASEEARLAALGFFAFGEKRAAKKVIREMELRTVVLEGELRAREISYHDRLKRDEEELEKLRGSLWTRLEQEYPIPAEPRKPDSPFWLELDTETITPVQISNLVIQQAILEFMEEDRLYSVPQLTSSCPACADLSNQRVSALVRLLHETGYVERVEDKRKAYFRRIAPVPYLPNYLRRAATPDYAPRAAHTVNSAIKQAILDFMVPGKLYTTTDIIRDCPVCADLTNQRVAALLRQLRDEGRVERFETNRKAYFQYKI